MIKEDSSVHSMGDSFFLLHNKKSMKPMSSAIVIVWPFASAATAAVASSLVESEAPMLMKPVRDGLRANSKVGMMLFLYPCCFVWSMMFH